MYLLDTDILIYSLKGNEAVISHLRRHSNDPIKTTVISLMELYYGAHKSQHKTGNLSKVKAIAQSIEIISPGPETAEIFGLLKSDLELSGNRLDDFDLIIAAVALSHNLTLVTNNIKHFNRIEDLKCENWAISDESQCRLKNS